MTVPQLDTRFLNGLRGAIASQLPDYLRQQRWFGGKARQIHSVQLADCIAMRLSNARALIALARVEYAEGRGETYVVPLLQGRDELSSPADSSRGILRISDPESSSEVVLTDALASQEFLGALLAGIQGNVLSAGERGSLQARHSSALQRLLPGSIGAPAGRVMRTEQSNTSIVYADRLILKFYRRAEEGINPDLEIGHFLTEVAKFPNTPPLGGSLEYRTPNGKGMTLGILQGFVPNQGDAWRCTLDSLGDFLADAAARLPQSAASSGADSSPALTTADLPAELSAKLASKGELCGLLGRRTAELHLALASSSADPAFAPERFTAAFRESLESSLHDLTVRNFDLLRSKCEGLPENLRQSATEMLKLEEDVLLKFHTTLEKEIGGARTRIHGDYHLGQVLYTGSDFVIIDFEGEPARSISERRAKRSPLQDVAGMLRSFHYAAGSASLAAQEKSGHLANLGSAIEKRAGLWQSTVSEQFLEEYQKSAKGASFLPAKREETEALLKLHLLEKAVYELGYELNNRPAWLAIPLRGIQELAGTKS
jgi:maltose alpha-D-glucosyltransferase / alpha-amylase